MVLYETLARLAEQKGVTTAQLALAWLLHKGNDIIPIPGTSKIHRLEENLAAASIELFDQEIAEIEQTVPTEKVEGHRCDPASAALLQH